jgi:hypothetical protein
MTPSEYAVEELVLWERALQAQHIAERELQLARNNRVRLRVRELIPEVHALATRADLLLAEAVKLKHTFRHHSFVEAGVTQPGDPGDTAGSG